jgi:O-antigen/teichoic acid export membrane protein
MGIWATVVTFETYASLVRIGIVNGMNRELPFALGAGQKATAISYAETTLSFTIFNIILILIAVPFFIFHLELNNIFIACISVILIRVTATFYTSYLSGTFRSDDQFNKLSNIQFSMLIVKLISAPLIVLGIYGFLLFELIQVIFNTILLHIYRPFRIKPKFTKGAFTSLLKIGLPLFITSNAINFIDTLPRLFIIQFGNVKLMGLYTPIFMFLSYVSMFPNVLTTYLYPKLSFKIGESNDSIYIWKKFQKINLVSILFILFSSVIIYFSLDFFVYFFPKYAGSVPYLKISILAYPFVVFKLGHMFNAILKKTNYMFLYVLLYASIQIASLFTASLFIEDVLYIVVYAQISTFVFMFFISLFMSYKASTTFAPFEIKK